MRRCLLTNTIFFLFRNEAPVTHPGICVNHLIVDHVGGLISLRLWNNKVIKVSGQALIFNTRFTPMILVKKNNNNI